MLTKHIYTLQFLFIFSLLFAISTNGIAQVRKDTLIPPLPNSEITITGKLISIIARPYVPKEYYFNKKRVRGVAIANITLYSAGMAGLYNMWYKHFPQSKFHFFNDNVEWVQTDKIGHAYSAYAESKASMELWRWKGISRKKRILIGYFSGADYQTVIETLDGFSSQWGLSWGDFAANIAGSSLLVA